MGKLTIEGATIGFDNAGFGKLLNDIKVEVIDKAQRQMTNSFGELIDRVDSVWQGQSAENFKKLMEFHEKTVYDAIGSCYGILRSEMVEVMRAMAELDDKLVSYSGGEQ